MLFTSYEFLLLFLPITWIGFALLRSRGSLARQAWLLVCSMFFYGWWHPAGLWLLGCSVTVNFLLARLLTRFPNRSRSSTATLTVGLLFNLGLLGYFKYAGFLAGAFSNVLGADWSIPETVLPLAISFFTFQQIAFLVDAWRQPTETGSFLQYALFVQFFPHLIAGPLVQHGDVVGQFADDSRFRPRWEAVATGIAIFVIGLFKKVVIADSLAPIANVVFAATANGEMVGWLDAWAGTLAYTLQLYFDFSGYSDMAIGLGWLFGVRMPVNFDAPYQAANLSDFWRRWHMTLSRFLRDYLYIPLGGSRCSPLRRSFNLFLTMLLGGLWHGAGWTFVVWGAFHGLFLAVNHVWSTIAGRCGWTWIGSWSWKLVARLVTLVTVMAGWVIFRSSDLSAAFRIFGSLACISSEGANTTLVEAKDFWPMFVLLALVQIWPTTQQLVPDPDLPATTMLRSGWWKWLEWRPTPLHGMTLSIVLIVCVTLLTRVKEFLYFQF